HFFNGIYASAALEHLAHLLEAILRTRVRLPQPQLSIFLLGPNHPLHLDDSIEAGPQSLDALLGRAKRCANWQVQYRDPFQRSTFVRPRPCLDGVIALRHRFFLSPISSATFDSIASAQIS